MLIYSRLFKLAPRLPCFTRLARLAVALPLAAGITVSAAQSAAGDVAVTPAAGGSFVVKDASGNTIRFRVTELGNVVISGLPSATAQTQPMCVNTSNGQVGPCAAGIGLGSVGPVGPKGDKGDAGAAGAAGVAGAVGAKGDKGDVGAAGAVGAKGDKGDAGVAGLAGAQGLKGDKGDKGDPGAAGSAGAAGAAGRDGPKGDKGDKGDAGAIGAAGPVGPSAADALYGDGSSGECTNCLADKVLLRTYSSVTLNHTNSQTFDGGLTLRSNGDVNITARGIQISPGRYGGSVGIPGTGASSASLNSGGRQKSLGQEAALVAAKDGYPTGGSGAGTALFAGIGDESIMGGPGGGGLRILAKGAITVNGTEFVARGTDGRAYPGSSSHRGAGGGGGAGGLIVMVSDTSISIQRSIFILSGGSGAKGLIALGSMGGGGGGAGGCLVLIAPVITVDGATVGLVANGGAYSGSDIDLGLNISHGFGGGGSLCADGGDGATTYFNLTPGTSREARAGTFGGTGGRVDVKTGPIKPSVLLAAF